jgi:hypothetical protein
VSKKKLRKLFDGSLPAEPLHLLGKNGAEAEWTVRLLTGPVLDLGFRRHRARFWVSDGGAVLPRKKRRVVGCNVTGEDSRWGYFAVFKGGESGTTLDFDEGRNHLTRRISVELRSTSYAYLMVGRLHVRLLGRVRFVGYLTLRRRGDRRRVR